jgi:hypothetical protein
MLHKINIQNFPIFIQGNDPFQPSKTETALKVIGLMDEPTTLFLEGADPPVTAELSLNGVVSFDYLNPEKTYSIKEGSATGATISTFKGKEGDVSYKLIQFPP